MMKYSEILEKDVDELGSMISEVRESLRVARFDRSTKEIKDNRLQRKTRRHLARLLTAVRFKEQ